MSQYLLPKIGNTPLIPYRGEVPGDNRIFIKEERLNPFGSHYDRVYKELFTDFVGRGELKPGDNAVETTSGSAGFSFAAIGRRLGYHCIVGIPAGGENARVNAISSERAEIRLTPAEDYVNGFRKFIKEIQKEFPGIAYLNHSMGELRSRTFTENTVTLRALGEIATEIQSKVDSVDYFVPALGNGSSLLGPARMFESATKIVGFESFQSAVGYERLHPGEYKRLYRIDPGKLSRHQMPGTSYQGMDFPHIRLAFEEGHVSEMILVSDRKLDEEYRHKTGREVPADMPRWDSIEMVGYGRSTRAGLAVALQIAARKDVNKKNIVLIAYDHSNRYDS